MRLLRAALLVFLASPGVARATSATLLERPLAAARGTAAARFDLIGLHWRGSGTVRFRTQSVAGHWSRWRTAEAEAEDLPDRGTAEWRRSRGWRLGSPYWVGSSKRIQYRLSGPVRRLRGFFVRSPLRGLSPRGL